MSFHMTSATFIDNFTAIVSSIAFGNNANKDQEAVKLSTYKMSYETKETFLKVL